MTSLVVKTDETNGEVDLVFSSSQGDSELLDELHDRVLPSVDGASQKGPVSDFIVAVRGRDFHDVVERLDSQYRARGVDVEVVAG